MFYSALFLDSKISTFPLRYVWCVLKLNITDNTVGHVLPCLVSSSYCTNQECITQLHVHTIHWKVGGFVEQHEDQPIKVTEESLVELRRLGSVTEFEDGGKDLVVKILDLFLLSPQLLEFKVRNLEEKRCKDQPFLGYHRLMSNTVNGNVFDVVELITKI